MKLTTLILIIAIMQVSATSLAQKITLSQKNVPLSKVFTEIRKQSGYDFVFSTSTLKDSKLVSINVKNTELEDVLKQVFEGQPLEYKINDKSVVVSKKAPSFLDKVATAIAVIDVHGRVVDEKGTPLAGASVSVKGGNGTITDKDGNFYLKNVDEKALVEISYIGYMPNEIKATGNLGNIILKISDSKLDEVQIIAYGTTSRRLSTGNVSTVKAEDIAKNPLQNPLLALQGRVPGVFVEQSTGFANSGVKVRIQGQNSIAKGNDPLYVIDGIPYFSQLLPSVNNSTLGESGSGGLAGNPLSFINPNDIESIDVLKDADATSIYGSRAANGAILITTKKGKAGDTRVVLNLQNAWAYVPKELAVLNTEQYLQMRNEAKQNDNAPITKGSSFSDVDLVYWSQTKNTDWQKTLVGGTARQLDFNGSVSGGTANSQFLLGGTYHKETTVFPGSFNDQKGSFHANLNNSSANQRFKIQFAANYLFDGNALPNQDLTAVAIQTAPNAPTLFTPDGKLNWETETENGSTFFTFRNPLQYTFIKYDTKTSNLFSNVNLSYLVVKGLEVKSNFGYTNFQSKGSVIFPNGFYPDYLKSRVVRSSKFADNNVRSYSIEPQIVYNTTVADGKLETLVGSTIYQNDQSGLILTGSGFSNDLNLTDLKSATTVTVNSTTQVKYRYNALFARINYNLHDTYIFNLSGRRDGSSRFGTENRFHNFYSAAGAWVFSNEKILKEMSFLSFGKLRASYGSTGNDQISDYNYLSLYQNTYDQGTPYQGLKGLEPQGHANPYLQWEETKKLQFGLDLGFFSDKLLLGLNYNLNRSSNQLLVTPLPLTTGFGFIAANLPATVQNTGWEGVLNVEIVNKKDFKWRSGFNITLPKNKLVKFNDLATSAYSTQFIVGQSINIQKLFVAKGVDPISGAYQFLDKEGKITTNPAYGDDQTAFVNLDPKFYGGFSNTISFKGFTFDFLFQFVKQKAPNYYYGFQPGIVNTNQPEYVLNRWKQSGDQASHQRFNSNFSLGTSFADEVSSTNGISDASYIRLQNASLSWDLPNRVQKIVHLNGFKLFLRGQNLLTISSYKGLDPETKSSTVLPPLRVITMGIQVTL